MKKIIFVLTLLFLALFHMQCEKNDDSESADLSVKLEKVHYLAQEQINVEYLTGEVDSLYLYHCNYQINGIIQRKEDGTWTNFMSYICPAIYLSGLMQASSNHSYHESFSIEEQGEYRAVIYYRLGADASDDLQVTSPVFYVE